MAARVWFSQESMRLVKQRLRSHKYEDARLRASECLATTPTLYILVPRSKKCPAAKKKIVVYPYPSEAVAEFENQLKTKQWFGFPKVDISVPKELWGKFEEFPPLFQNSTIPNQAIPEHMKKYFRQTNRTVIPGKKKSL